MTDSLSIQQARKLVLLSQRLPPAKQTGRAIAATLSAIEHLGYIQIDTISAIQRAHHHTLWNRNPRYKTAHRDQLIADKQVFEYWSHAAAYLPMRDYRYSLPRKQAIANGDQNHWYERDERLMKSVLHIHHLALEPNLVKTDAFFLALHKELACFLQFNNCKDLRLHRTSPANFKPVLQKVINS